MQLQCLEQVTGDEAGETGESRTREVSWVGRRRRQGDLVAYPVPTTATRTVSLAIFP